MNRLMGLAAVGSAVFLAGSANAATLVADYGFQGGDPLASSVAGAPDLTVVGNGTATYTTDTVAGQMRQVVDLPAGTGLNGETDAILPNNNYSIVLLAKFNAIGVSTNATSIFMGKAIDFQNRTTDSGLYNAQGALDFYDGAGSDPTAEGTSAAGLLSTGDYVQIVFTRATDGTADAYVNGTLAFTFNDSDGQAVIGNGMAQQYLNYLIDDNANPVGFTRENEGGDVARIRLYNGVLDAAEVGALDEVPEPTTGLVICAGAIMLLPRRRRSVGDGARPT